MILYDIIWYYMILYIIWYYMLYNVAIPCYSRLFHWSCESSAEYQLLFYNSNIIVRLKMLNDACILDQRWKYGSKRRNRWKLKPCSYSHFHVLPTCLSVPLCLAVVRSKYVFSNGVMMNIQADALLRWTLYDSWKVGWTGSANLGSVYIRIYKYNNNNNNNNIYIL